MSNINDMQIIISTNPDLNKYADRLKDSSLPRVNFADYLVEQGVFSSREELTKYIRETSIPQSQDGIDKSANGTITKGGNVNQKIPDDIAIAVFELPKYKYYTGNEGYTSCSADDAEQDYYVNLGMRYKSSCFDFTYQDDYYTTNLDFTGMTNEEKYLEIYEHFKHCYGENFLDASAINYVAPVQSDPYMGILDKFSNYVTKACGLSEEYPENSEHLRQLRKEALYGDMSDEEIRAAIREKYPSAGELTFRDFYKMINEMNYCGIGGFANGSIEWVFRYNGGITYREAMLDTPVASKHLQTMLEDYQARIYQHLPMDKNLGTVLNELAAEFGAAGGVSVNSVPINSTQSAKDDFVWIKI